MQSLTYVTLGRDPEALEEIRGALNGSQRARLLADCDNSVQLLADVLRLRPSAAILVLAAQDQDRGFSLIKQLGDASPDTAIICAAREASPALILGSMRSGAHEFLQLPIASEELQTILNRVEEFIAARALKRSGRTIAVFSAKGGAGVSFFAANLAAALSVSTVLTDLNLQAGDAASFLGLETKYSLTDFVKNLARLDDSLIASLVTQHSPHLSLVAAPLEAHEAEDIKPEHITEVLHLLGQRFQCLVMDLQHTFDPVTVAALDLADDILVVMTLDIPGIRNTRRALKVFERLGYPREKIRVVVNRWSRNIDVELKKVEAHLDEQLIGFVPNDYAKVMSSINLGRPLVQSDPASKVTLEIKRIAALVENHNHDVLQPPRKRLFSGMFGRHSETGPLELSAMPETP